jgi:hypothetical protein
MFNSYELLIGAIQIFISIENLFATKNEVGFYKIKITSIDIYSLVISVFLK